MAVSCILLLWACIVDYRKGRIPNGIIIFLLLWGAGCEYGAGGTEAVARYALKGVLMLLLLYPLFKTGMLGAGDVKLYAVTMGYFSGYDMFLFLFVSLLFAAIISLGKIILEGNGRERLYYLLSYMAEVVRTGKWRLYMENAAEKKKAGICLSGPIFASLLLYLGGVY